MVKHQLVAQAYSKRKDLEDKGRLSLTFHSEDPAVAGGVEEVSPEEFSSTWAAALPRLVQRRNALVAVGAEGLGLKRAASEESLSVRSVSIRNGRFSYDSRRNSMASVNSQFSFNQSELDHLQRLFKTSGGRKMFKRFKKRSNRITDSSCNGSVTSNDPPSNASSVRVIPAVTLDPLKMKEKLGMFHVPPPGRSVDFSSRSKAVVDDSEFVELQERLKTLTTHSVQVQTSLTDLSRLGRKPEVRDASTQLDDDLPPPASTTTSSSQTEFNALLRKNPIEANVMKMKMGDEESSSIPSSYEAAPQVVEVLDPGKVLRAVPPPVTKVDAHSSRQNYNRGRRGGIIDDGRSAVKITSATPLFKTGHTLEEVELKARTPMPYDAKLQNLPDTIVAISTPSS